MNIALPQSNILLFTIASLLGGLAQEPRQLPTTRVLQGVGGGVHQDAAAARPVGARSTRPGHSTGFVAAAAMAVLAMATAWFAIRVRKSDLDALAGTAGPMAGRPGRAHEEPRMAGSRPGDRLRG
ncbi:hypothetical protein ACM01_07485 [Streptomyces viridochromogenes]|uniref:Uncharacterized protein n=1 Tax=Streptomyces viridochromogenes TaxID=1938 RepID=A0A0J7ZKV4_STRVR|nr:hypothetical protein ACM01_07485 [Streptomyces viridochromogenes]